MSKLVFKIGEETVPTILNYKEFASSPFADQLNSCCELLKYILHKWEKPDNIDNCRGTENKRGIYTQPVVNNIIAFLGERGSGKSSCLHSIKKIVPEFVGECAKDIEFMDIIDPSFFDEHHNILELFLGELYHGYEDMVAEWERLANSDRQKIRNLYGWFSKVRQSIKFLSAHKLELPDEQEGLTALSEGVNLRMHVCELVKAYLICKKKRYLVVSIDDIDLNIREAYRMMEQIRKYLDVPNVAILMAGKLEQLKNSIILNLTEYYKSILTTSIDIHEIQMMADRYLDKFIPLERRISMPTLDNYSTAQLEIINRDEDVASAENQFETVEFAVLSLIYKKCGYLLYNYEGTPSLIIPDNLRELRSLVTTLYEMDDRKNNPKAHSKNKALFKEYFHNQWLHKLDGKQQEIARIILTENDVTKINKTVVALLHEHTESLRLYSAGDTPVNPDKSDLSRIRLKEIVNPANYSENLSIGDVMTVLNNLRNVSASSKINYLIFFVNTFYSMELYELYDEMTERVDCYHAHKEIFIADFSGKQNRSHSPKLKNTKEYKIPDFLKLVGNSFFTLTGESFLPILKKSDYSRELSLLNGTLLFELIDEIIKKFEDNVEVITTPDFIAKLNIVEFFIACTSRRVNLKEGRYSYYEENNWRAEIQEFYFYSLNSDRNNLLFDVTAPFVNLILPYLSYNRFNPKLISIATKCHQSLLRKLYKKDRRYKSTNIMHDLISRITIRNTEVLHDLLLWLENNKDIYLEGKKNDLQILRDFYGNFNKNIGEYSDGYSVRTYELTKDKSDYHTIDFTPLAILSDFLNGLNTKNADEDTEKLRKENLRLFYRIYRKENMLAVGTMYTLQELIAILRDSKEGDIPTKDEVITNVMQSNDRINSNLLVEYLAAIGIVEKVVFSKYFDDDLFEIYNSKVTNNLTQRQISIENDISRLEQKITAYNADYDGINSEVYSVDRRIASIRNGLSRNKVNLSAIEQKQRECKNDIEKIEYDIARETSNAEVLNKALEKAHEEYFILQKNIHQNDLDEINKKKDEIKTDINAKEKNLVTINERLNVLRTSVKEKANEYAALEKRMEKIRGEIDKDSSLYDNFLGDKHVMEQRRDEIKSALDHMNRNLGILKKEYSAFLKRKENIINTLNKTGR